MRQISRREFLRRAALAAAAAPFAGLATRGVLAQPNGNAVGQIRRLATLERTLQRGAQLGQGTQGTYFRLAYGPGEPYVRRLDLAQGVPVPPPGPPGQVRSILNFVHYTDFQLADPQSPARVEFLDRFADRHCEPIPFESAFRSHETLILQAVEQTNQAVQAIRRSPVTNTQLQFAMCTGDNIDNEQFNEVRWFIDVMDGLTVDPNSGAAKGYEGVQEALAADPEYWHPDAVPDKFKQQYGFPDYPGLLEEAVAAFQATGVGMPWFSCFGNHDGLMQGNAHQNPVFEAIAVGSFKVTGPPPGINPCDELETFRSNPQAFLTGPGRPVTADAGRHIITRREYIEEHFQTAGTPLGHGFTQENLETGVAYYVNDDFPQIRMIVLDTTNPGGWNAGSIGTTQFAWLEERLIEAHSRFFDTGGTLIETGNPDRVVVVFSHHGLESLDNPVNAPDPFTPDQNDLPRIQGPEIEALLHRFPNVVLWVTGHTHHNRVVPVPDPEGKTNGFWDVTTSAVADWPCQARLVEITTTGEGTLSIFCTMVDHDGPADPTGATGLSRLASIFRELASNDPQHGIDGGAQGGPSDRNVELVVPAPFAL